ncbi:DUF1924 domain-containing protein [Endothiovibrio diazotrophicus]
MFEIQTSNAKTQRREGRKAASARFSFTTFAPSRLCVELFLASALAAASAQAEPGSASAGEAMWTRPFSVDGENRSCADCHTADLTAAGRHVRTRKTIEPMAPSVNPQRLSDPKKVEKWFKRNCRWTLGRECNDQEKGDFLAYIRSR